MLNRKRNNSGMVLALTMIFLVVAVSIAGVLISSGGMGLQQSENQKEAHQARLAAESGLGYLSALIRQISLSGDEDEVITQMSEGLNSTMVGTNIYKQGNTLYIPPVMIENGEGGTFSAQMSKSGDNYLLIVNGTSGGTSRTVLMEMTIDDTAGKDLFKNGLLLGGKLVMSGNAKFTGITDGSEAKVYSTYTGSDEAFSLSGHSILEGDLYSANPNGTASVSSGASVGGKKAKDSAIWDHIHFGEPPVGLPRPDPTVFEPHATNVFTGSTSGDQTLTNIRIPANTNPVFSGDVTIKGIVYIESPNKVHFSGKANIIGVIVTEDPGLGQSDDNLIKFSGQTSIQGVENLPDEPQYTELRKLPGAAILAPGYEMELSGQFGTVGGALVADKFKITGQAGGTIKGPIISYSDKEFKMSGNASIKIDRGEYDWIPPGFTSGKSVLTPVMSTYTELRE